MRKPVAFAMTTVLLLLPTTIVGQDAEAEPVASSVPSEVPATSPDVAYACISYDPTVNDDASLAIFEGEFNVVPSSNCELAAALGDFEPVKESGKGTKRSKPFILPAGDYEVKVNWGKGCRFSKDLPDPGTMYLNNIEEDEVGLDFSQSTYAYGVDEGRYYVKVNTITGSKCKWAFRISPFEA